MARKQFHACFFLVFARACLSVCLNVHFIYFHFCTHARVLCVVKVFMFFVYLLLWMIVSAFVYVSVCCKVSFEFFVCVCVCFLHV